MLAFGLLGRSHDALSFAKVDVDDRALDTLDHAVHDRADFALVFGKDGLLFGFADALQDHLLGGLGGDAAKTIWSDILIIFQDAGFASILV